MLGSENSNVGSGNRDVGQRSLRAGTDRLAEPGETAETLGKRQREGVLTVQTKVLVLLVAIAVGVGMHVARGRIRPLLTPAQAALVSSLEYQVSRIKRSAVTASHRAMASLTADRRKSSAQAAPKPVTAAAPRPDATPQPSPFPRATPLAQAADNLPVQ